MAESMTYPVPKRMAGAHCGSRQQYDSMYSESVNNPEAFWGPIAETFHWQKKWDKVLNHNFAVSKGPVNIEWFKGGLTNITYNALDRHVKDGKGDQVAFYWEGNEPGVDKTVTYGEMLEEVCKFANVLKAHGVKKGDRVALYLPMILELPIAMLACARIGAMHSVIFGGFSAKSVADRLIDAKADLLVTADGVYRGDKPIALKKIADEALALSEEGGHKVRTCIVVQWIGQGNEAVWDSSYKWWHEEMAAASGLCEPEWVDAEHPLFMLYTSGSTGTPKGVVHTTGGYMVYAHTTFMYVFDYRDKDVYFCTADCGWITGHTYITYGPLLAGATSVMFEGVPTYPDAGRFWAVCEKYAVNSFYTAPTAIRALKRFGDDFVNSYDLSSLRVLGTVGEPINPEAWVWYNDVVGKGQCAIVDTYWQTETGGHIMTPIPGAIDAKPGSCTVPFFGVDAKLLDNDGKEIEGEGEGFIVVKQPWPGMMRTVYGNHQRFEVTYFAQFDGYYCTGDGGRRDKDGYMWVTGRVDDVMNVSGHRIGTAEVESALTMHAAVAESACVQVPHDVKGNAIFAFVILRPGFAMDSKLQGELKSIVRQQVGPFAQPDTILEAPGLPKTRSGKIMRRILRKVACHEFDSLGDVTTLAEPQVVEQLVAAVTTSQEAKGAK